MSLDYKGKYCKRCNKHILAQRKGTNHILHLIITILTIGFWAIIWIGVGIKFGGWQCSHCGINL